jgi:signal transduction histidine kinase
MNQATIRFSARYLAALRPFLSSRAGANYLPATRLGREAVKLPLETLELARIHEAAVVTLESRRRKTGWRQRAEIFFNATLIPIEATHGAAGASQRDLHRLNLTLDRRTAELAAANLQLRRGGVACQCAAKALKTSGKHYAKLLRNSLHAQEDLRHLTHQGLTNQENERRRVSRELQDEIAQTLLGVNVRLLALKQIARANPQRLKNEIASTQRLVVTSTQAVRRVAREVGRAGKTGVAKG